MSLYLSVEVIMKLAFPSVPKNISTATTIWGRWDFFCIYSLQLWLKGRLTYCIKFAFVENEAILLAQAILGLILNKCGIIKIYTNTHFFF